MNTAVSEFLFRNKTSKKVITLVVINIIFALLTGILAAFKGVITDYTLLLIPTLFVNLVFTLYGCSQKADSNCMIGICMLNICAAISRALLNPGTSSVISTSVFMIAGLIGALMLGYLQRILPSTSKVISTLALLGTIGFLALCFFMNEVNEAKAWLVIGGRPILQLTEFAKLCYVIYIGSLFSKKTSDTYILIPAVTVTVICAALLVAVVNEIGTLLIMGLTFFVVSMLKLKRFLSKFIIVFLALLLVFILVLAYFTGAEYLDRWKCGCNEPCSSEFSVCPICKTEKPIYTESFRCPTCRYKTWDANPVESKTANCELCCNDGFLTSPWGKICKKAYDRFSVTINYDKVKGTGMAYHMDQSAKSMKVGRFFGNNESIVYVPNHDTDSAIASLINRLGLVFAIVLLFAYLLIFSAVIKADSPVRIMAVSALVFQALITYLGVVNVIPLTGIGVPLISRGGSNLIVNYLLIYLMLTATNSNKEVKK